MAKVVLDGVSRVFPGGTIAVDDVRLDVEDREFLVLVGPSGCGKSTTLRIIAGLEEATEGVVQIGGREVNDLPPKKRDVAMVFQNYALYPHMNVMRNMGFALELRYGAGWLKQLLLRLIRPAIASQMAAKRKEMKQQVLEASRLLGIEHLVDRMPRQLSGGERQRVALGRAIVRNPAVFLFDEPLSNLDAKLRVEMRRELKQLHQRLGITMIYVTHDQVEAMTLGDRIAVMNHGAIQQIGTAKEVYEKPQNRFVASFIGSFPMNFIQGQIRREGDSLQFSGMGCSMLLPGREGDFSCEEGGQRVEVGIRPEDVSLEEGSGNQAGWAKVVDVDDLGEAQIVTLQWQVSSKGQGEVKEMPDEMRQERRREKAEMQNAARLTARLTAKRELRTGEVVPISFLPARVHLFDGRSGERICAKN